MGIDCSPRREATATGIPLQTTIDSLQGNEIDHFVDALAKESHLSGIPPTASDL
jgi:hypothetical protein